MYNRIVLALLRALFLLVSFINRRPPRSAPLQNKVKSVLLMSTTGLGDTVMATPSFAAARKCWPQARIYALLHRRWADLFRMDPHLDEILVYPGKFKKVFSVVRSLRKAGPDLALILHGNDPDVVPLAYLSGAGFIVGRSASRFAFLLDRGLDLSDPNRPNIQKYLDLLRAVAHGVEEGGEEIFLSEAQRLWAADYWSGQGLGPEEKLVVLNPGGSHQAKRWPDHYWRELILEFNQRPDVRPALFGSPGELPYMQKLARGLSGPAPLIAARPNPSEAAALLTRAAILIGPDSGLSHVAVGLGLPCLIIFGPDNPARTGPFHNRAPALVLGADSSVCPKITACKDKKCPDNVCLKAVTPEMVIDKFEYLLGKLVRKN